MLPKTFREGNELSKIKFVLASASPRRREILEGAGIKPIVAPSVIDEDAVKETDPAQKVMRLALLKGADAARGAEDAYIISADTIVVLNGKIMGKPRDKSDALFMLERLSGAWHEVYTGFCVIEGKSGAASVRYEKTRVKFRQIERGEALRYIDSREPFDKAGSYGIQGRGRVFVERIEGDFYNVVGLPICALSKMLKEDFGIEIL